MFIERSLLNGEFATARIVPHDRILFDVQVIEGGIVDPELLDELKLTTQVSVERDKIDALIEFGIVSPNPKINQGAMWYATRS